MHVDDDLSNTSDSKSTKSTKSAKSAKSTRSAKSTKSAKPAKSAKSAKSATASVPGAAADADGLTLPLAEERLTASVLQGERGQVHIHKRVAYEQQRATVPFTIEEAIIEHIPADRFDPHAPRAADELIIPLVEERLIVRKETVVREYLRVRKQSRVESREVSAELRREVVEVDETPNPEFGEQAAPLMREMWADEVTESDAR